MDKQRNGSVGPGSRELPTDLQELLRERRRLVAAISRIDRQIESLIDIQANRLSQRRSA